MPLIVKADTSNPEYRAGCAIVAAGSKGVVTLGSGVRLTWGERLFGGYSAFYYVDISSNVYSDTFKCSSLEGAIEFEIDVRIDYQVTNPARVVTAGITEPGRIFASALRSKVSAVAAGFSIQQTVDAKRVIDAAISAMKVDPAITIIAASSTVRADAAAAVHLRKIAEEKLRQASLGVDHSLNKLNRDQILAILESPDKILAHRLATNDPAFQEALTFKLNEMRGNWKQQVELLEMLVNAKVIEPHDLHDKYGPLVNAALSALAGPKIGTEQPPLLAPNASTPKTGK